jgi:hypothetical protein
VLENGCGVGIYLKHLAQHAGLVVGLEYDLERARKPGRSAIMFSARPGSAAVL